MEHYTEPPAAAVRRVLDRWELDDLSDTGALRRLTRQLRTLIATEPWACICELLSSVLVDALETLGVPCRYVDEWFEAKEMMPHTWVVVDASTIPTETDGSLLVDGSVLQFFGGDALVQAEESGVFDDVAVLFEEDPRLRYYARGSGD